MFARKPRTEIAIRVVLIVTILLNAVGPTLVLAETEKEPVMQPADKTSSESPRALSEQSPKFFEPPIISYPQQSSPEKDEPASPIPPKDQVEFTLTTEPAIIPANGQIQFSVFIRNNSDQALTNLVFTDQLETGLEYVQGAADQVTYDERGRVVRADIDKLPTGEELKFSYSVNITNSRRTSLNSKIWLHDVELQSSDHTLRLRANAVIGAGISVAGSQSEIAVLQSNGGWNDLGRIKLHMEKNNVGVNALVISTPTRLSQKGPELQFNLDVFRTSPVIADSSGNFNEQEISIAGENRNAFKKPAFIEINLDEYIDLKDIPAGQEPYVATYDEENKIWVKVPILEQDIERNSVTVEAAHFSTWGAGLGSSLPQNGANVLLFDQPYTSLFTGASRYSIPIWTPPGRAGMQPGVSLSYSSGTVDGVLGDVQAPWVGMGWNIDDVEIVRKITTDENGYGYRNEFALTLNGSLYQLVRDENSQNRYYTDKAAFLYIERHNYAFDNTPSLANTTGEWWEVVTTDGTRYRLGWNNDSEQLALMYGYSCTTNGISCYSPDGAYASLGYAGKAKDLVALRWRVDRITDTHGNFMEYRYAETQPSGSTTIAPFDRESYLESIRYTGFQDPEGTANPLTPAYEVRFNLVSRTAIGDIPTEFNIWDNIDSKYLDSIQICSGNCGGTGSTTIRTYQFGYSLSAAPNANGTLTLTNLQITGGGYSENGKSIPLTKAPKIRFTYQDKPNRATGNGDVFNYPRLATINNGSGGVLTFTYGNDGRDNTSWYNYRVANVVLDSGMGTAKKQTYAYGTPVYSGQGGNPNLGSLIGYPTVTESLVNFNNGDAKILDTKHTFGTVGLDIGRELQTELMDNAGTVHRKTINIYVTDNSRAPFQGWNYRYLGSTSSFIRSGGSLVLTTKATYFNDPATGNPLVASTYLGNSLYRKTYYEYLTNPDPAYYILDKTSRVLLVDAANQIYSDTRYHYDATISQPPTRGDLTLVQRFTGNGNQTVDTWTDFDVYGNPTSTRAYKSYGTVNTLPSSTYVGTGTTYDTALHTHPVAVVDPMGNTSTSDYLYTLGVPFQTTDPNQWTTRTTYDGLGRTLSVTPPGLGQPGTWFIYPSPDSNGNITAPHSVEMQILDTIAGKYRSVWGIYDGAGRMIQTQVGNGNELVVNTTSFNAQGLVTQQSLPYSANGSGGNHVSIPATQNTVTEYDALGRVTKVTAPGNIISLTSYDGLTTSSLDPNGNKVSRTTDGFGRMTAVAEFSNSQAVYSTTQYFYDAADRLIQVRDGQFNLTTIQYDWLGRKLEMDDPDMGNWFYEYDARGNMALQKDARNYNLTFFYDDLNRLWKKVDGDTSTPDTVYTYGTEAGKIGLRIGMTDPSGSTAWDYSNFGRTVTESRTIGGATQSVTTTSDWLGRPISTTYGDGEVVSYTYDELGRPDTLKSDQVTLVDLAYNVLGQIDTQALGNGVTVDNDYDDGGTNRLTRRTATKGSTLFDLSYAYDPNGNISRLTDNQLGETHFFQYDFLNRLTSAIAGNGVLTNPPATPQAYGQQFSYDKVGNMLQMNSWGTPPTQVAYQEGNLRDLAHQDTQGENYFASYRQSNSNYAPPMQIGFPSTSVLDNFNRTNGSIGSNWTGYTTAFGISSNQLIVNTGGSDSYIFWGNAQFGADQEAYVTISQMNAGSEELSLLLKSQANDSYGYGTIEIFYMANPDILQVWTYDISGGWVKHGLDISVTLAEGDQLGTRALADGTLEVYKNSTLLATRNIGSWTYYDQGGYVGVWFANAYGQKLDDFGGGNVPMGATNTPTITQTPLPPSQTPSQTNTPNQSPTSTPAFTPTSPPVNSGWVSPTGNAAVTSSSGDNNGFQTGPANAYNDDTALAVDTDSGNSTSTTCSDTGKDRHVFYGYDFSSVPSGSTIQGIEVRLDMKVDSTYGSPRSCIELSWDGGLTWTAAKTTSTNYTTSEATYILGGTGDTWGRAWSTGELANLRVRITNIASSTSRDFSLDWIPVRISYIPSGANLTPSWTPATTNTPTPTITATFTSPSSSTPSNTVTVTASVTSTNTQIPTNTLISTYTPSPVNTKTPTAPVTPVTFWPALAWAFDSTVDGWGNPSGYITSFGWQTGGYIGGSITGNDPFIFSADNLGVSTSSNKIIKVRFKNATASTSAQMFFITTASTNWEEAKSKVFPVTPNSDYIEYTIDMSTVAGWTGTLRGLRFDPGYTTGSFSVDYIKVGTNQAPTATPTSTLIPTPTATQIPSVYLMGHWNFEGVTGSTVPDVADGDNPATLINNPTIINNGAYGKAVSFVASNQYASIAHHSDLVKNGSFTVSAWVNPSVVVTDRTQYIVNKGVNATDFDYGFITTTTFGSSTATPTPPANIDVNGKLVFRVGDLTPNKVVGPVLPINTWTLVTGVYDSTAGELRLYINGTLSAVEKVTGTVSMGTGALTFSGVAPYQFSGSLDEVRFYNRALTDSEVTDLVGTFSTPTPLPTASFTPTTTATITLTATSLSINAQQWGTGADGNLIVSSGQTYNLNTQNHPGRSCTDGGDGVAYNVTTLGSTVAILNASPSSGCLNPGDEVMLIQLTDASPTNYNAGNYEFLRVANVTGNNVVFSTPKLKWYGNGFRSDSEIGTAAGQLRVMLIRIPNYNTLSVNGALTANAFDGNKNGVVAFRVLGSLTGSGTISANKLGFNNGSGYGKGNIGGVGSGGGGGSYGAQGTNGNWATAGSVYGEITVKRLFLGSSGGDAGTTTFMATCGSPQNNNVTPCQQSITGPLGAQGGGIVFVSVQTINFGGTISSVGEMGRNRYSVTDSNTGQVDYSYSSGGGSGGSVRIEGSTITLGTANLAGGAANSGSGTGGQGRFAIYYQTNATVTNTSVTPYLSKMGQAGTPTPTSTPLTNPPSPYGSGRDGNLVVNAGQTINLSTQNSNSRTCADGGDGVSYAVTSLTSSSATLASPIGLNCLLPADEVMLLHASGAGTNIGQYEFLRVGGVSNNIVYFTTLKTNYYGDAANSDANIGTGVGQQRIMLIRVPNYNNVAVNGTLTANAFDGNRNGVVVFRALNTINGSGTISAYKLGFNNGSGYGAGNMGGDNSGGGGGSYGTQGTNGLWATAGNVYGEATVKRLYFGSAGGDAGTDLYMGTCGSPQNHNVRPCQQSITGPLGAQGGGIVLISAQIINLSGTVSSSGEAGRIPYSTYDSNTGSTYYSYSSGGGSGGSIRIEGGSITLGPLNPGGGAANSGSGAGGLGRIAIYYASSLTNSATICAQASTYCKNSSQIDTPTPTPTATATPTAAPSANPGTTGLVSWWTLGESSGTRYDSHTFGNHLTDNNTVGSALGKLGGLSAKFVAANIESLSINDNASLSMNNTSFTIATWVKLSSKANHGDMVIKWTDAAPEYALVYNNASDRFNFHAGLNSSTGSAVTANNLGSPSVGVWYFVVAWYDGTSLNISINNGEPNSVGYTGGVADGSNSFRLGDRVSSQYPFDGSLDEVVIYKRVLTSAERTWLYNNGSGRTYSDLTASSGWYSNNYTYAGDQPHAVTSVNRGNSYTDTYTYDANGNMTCRTEAGVTYLQTYSAENRIASIQKLKTGTCAAPGALTAKWDFAYDGDGVRTTQAYTTYDATGLPQGTTITRYYFGGAVETTGSSVKKYYSFAGQTIAMKDASGFKYFLSDHLGSVSLVLDASGTILEQQRYLPFGAPRTMPPYASVTSTDFTYTGQRDIPGTGLMDYKARFYSPCIMHFVQPDTLIPDIYNPQALNRFSYVNNNPIRYNDPTGHMLDDGCRTAGCNLTPLQKALDAQKLAELQYDPTGQKQKKNREIAESILYDGTELLTSILLEPADWAYSAYHCANGDCSPWMLAGLLPFIPNSAGKYGDELVALVGEKGFDTFDQLKRYLGPAGDGMEWHHIVEQSQIIKSGFSPRTIHNTSNIIAVEEGTHDLVSAVYNTNVAGPGSGKVRNWLAGQSFGDQYEFGLQVLRNLGVIP